MTEASTRPPATGEEAPGTLEELQQTLGYHFKDPELLRQALTHESFAHEDPGTRAHNERLEFLGDAVLGYEICRYLYQAHPDLPEGKLAQIKAHVVSSEFLAQVARGLHLGRYLRLGRGEELSRGRERRNVLADSLEAVLGAMCLDGGLTRTRALIQRLWRGALDNKLGIDKDFKSQLQEFTQSHHRTLPTYLVVGEEGPAHQRTFRIRLELQGQILGEGVGASKQKASQEAARRGLAKLQADLDRLRADAAEAPGPGRPDEPAPGLP